MSIKFPSLQKGRKYTNLFTSNKVPELMSYFKVYNLIFKEIIFYLKISKNIVAKI
jgi:hypothetical protein